MRYLILLLALTSCAQGQMLQGVVGTSRRSVILTAYNIQNSTTNWGSCGSTACAGGAGNSTSLTQTAGIASPSVSGASMLLSFDAPATGNNALWYNKPGNCDSCTCCLLYTSPSPRDGL